MTWSDFYLFCFLVGFSLSVLSFLAGAVHLHLPFKWHLPFHGGHHGAGGGIAKGGAHLSWFNASSVLAFLAWFGGTGYLLTKHSNLIAIFCLAIAVAAGLTGGWIVFRFMARLLRDTEVQMNEWDYRHEGSVGRVSISIPAGGTGEVIFEQHGVRRSAGARSDDGSPFEKGAEVVISRYEKGMAYVRKWDEFTRPNAEPGPVAQAFRPEGFRGAGNYLAASETLTPKGGSYKSSVIWKGAAPWDF